MSSLTGGKKSWRARRLIDDEPDIPALMDLRWAPWSIGLADYLYMHQLGGVSTNVILKQRPGGHTETKTRQCLAFLDLAGCAMYQRGVWRLSGYGLLWRERQDRHALDKLAADGKPEPLLVVDDAADLDALADAAALHAETDAGHHVLRETGTKPTRRRSDARTADEALQETLHARIQTFDGSTSLQVSAILRVLTASNVSRLMELLPDSFRPTFVSWCCRHYLFVPDDVERITLFCGIGAGRAMATVAKQDMQESIAAICSWLLAAAADENSSDQDVCQAVAAARQEAASRRAASTSDDAWMSAT